MSRAQEAELYRLKQLLTMQTELLAGIAHELNTPLNSIIGFTELLVDGRVNPAAKEHKDFLNHILAGGRQLAALTKRLGDLTNLNAQRPWRVQPVNLHVLLAEVSATLRMTLMRRRVDLTVQVSPELGVIHSDEVGIKQVAYTLLWSAIQATPEGERVCVRVQPETLDRLRLEVDHEGDASDEAAIDYEIAALEAIVSGQGGFAGADTQTGKGYTLFTVLPLGS